jgi:hypothetical protein
MYDGTQDRNEFRRRIDTIRRILDVADPVSDDQETVGVARETRGMVVVLLFASYENILKSLCRGILETAISLRVGNRRLRTGFRQFAVHNLLQSVSASKEDAIWKEGGRKLLECAFEARSCTINSNVFPTDGTFMKRSQVILLFDLFGLGDPAPILKEVWESIDTIVTQRNAVAHGRMTPEEVGREYTSRTIRDLIDRWEARWLAVVGYIETMASGRDFFRA